MIAGAAVWCHGALSSADKKSTALKWMMVGVAKALPAWACPLTGGPSAMSVTAMNCRPMSAPADEPTMT
jgi:hypothetical protein